MGRRRVVAWPVPLAAIVLSLACADTATQPTTTPTFGAAGGQGCPKRPTVIVTDEAALRHAATNAGAGDIIALDGMIAVGAGNVRLVTDGVTLTCATDGSGIVFRNNRRIEVFANHVVVDHLVVDGGGSALPILVTGSDGPDCCVNVGLTDNLVRGFQLTGVFVLRAIAGLDISGNRFEGSPTALGAIHVQGTASDGTIAWNSVDMPEGAFAGISVLDARRMAVEHNRVFGAPFAGLRVGTDDSEWRSNTVDGATGFGVLFEFPLRTGNLIRNNRLTNAGTAGMFVRNACGNIFLGNNLGGNAGDVGAIFDASSGANRLAGNGGLVSDGGAADCTGDGKADGNVITGHGPVAGGLHLGPIRHAGVVITVNGEAVVVR
ncbi:MAG TPA: right-handed parallel beta-helix repeat-containing protein [Gemmatimonadales bacterium]